PDAGQVIGQTLAQATQALAGFTVTTVGSDDPAGVVTAMSPAPGTRIAASSTVTLTVEGAAAPLPSVTPPAGAGAGPEAPIVREGGARHGLR
ncbi:MAG TPA: PASTA domain-containing protein, partial [Microbacteriaceae bacterium]|nr:PASTA domain-containing protein [Microbacteriaceae bacterium]